MPRKMSDILLEFCRPLMPKNPTHAQVEAAATHATGIWNLGLQPAAERERFWAQIVATFPPEMPPPVAAELLRILRSLLDRRLTEFAADGRAVVECECVSVEGEPRLRVAFVDRGGRN